MCLNDLERSYWQGTEVGRIGGCEFQGAIFVVDGSCKDGKMGAGSCRFQGLAADKCTRVGTEDDDDDDVFYLFLQKQKIGAELHIYLAEGTYHKRLFRGPNTNDMKK